MGYQKQHHCDNLKNHIFQWRTGISAPISLYGQGASEELGVRPIIRMLLPLKTTILFTFTFNDVSDEVLSVPKLSISKF